MNKFVTIMLAAILAGFALLKVPLSSTFLSSFEPIIHIIAIIAIVLFSFVLIYKAVLALIGKD